MKTEFKILTGTAKEVEAELNKLNSDYVPTICGVSATDSITVVVVELFPKP